MATKQALNARRNPGLRKSGLLNSVIYLSTNLFCIRQHRTT